MWYKSRSNAKVGRFIVAAAIVATVLLSRALPKPNGWVKSVVVSPKNLKHKANLCLLSEEYVECHSVTILHLSEIAESRMCHPKMFNPAIMIPSELIPSVWVT